MQSVVKDASFCVRSRRILRLQGLVETVSLLCGDVEKETILTEKASAYTYYLFYAILNDSNLKVLSKILISFPVNFLKIL